jgi:hypothetical protein
LNHALAKAEAELVANVDADDQVHPALLRCQLQAMKQHPQFTIMSSEWIRIDGVTSPNWSEIDPNVRLEVADVTKTLAFYNPILHSSVMMRKQAIAALGGYSEDRRVVIDYDLWVRCAAAGLLLGRMQVPLVAQRIHPGQFYLHSGRLRYLFEGVQVQMRAMRALGGTRVYLPLMVLRVFWGVLPLGVRLRLRNLWDSWRPRRSDVR